MTAHCPHCGVVLNDGKRRSGQDHRRFFGVINAAFTHWPDAHEFRPSDAEHLRAWLLCKADHCERVDIPVVGDDPAIVRLAVLGVEGALKAAETYAFVEPFPQRLVVFTPKSIAFDKLDQKAFGPVREAVEGIIEQEIGIPAGQLLKETERAA